MRIYKTGSLAHDATVGIKEYRCNIIDNIERTFIGQKLKILSWGDIMHQVTVTILDDMDTVDALREAMILWMNQGLKFRVTLQNYEPVFGPEFNYSLINSLTSFQLLSEGDEPYQISSTIDGMKSEWTFTIGYTQTITPYYLYPDQLEFPSTLRIENISRVKQVQSVVRNMYFGQSANGFNVTNPQSIITFAGSREDIAKAKSYLIQKCLRDSPSIDFGDRVWIFEDGVSAANVFLLSMEDLGAIAIGSNEFRFNATLALAVS